MIIQIDNGKRVAIEGVATEAVVSVRGDEATVAIVPRDLVALPRRGQALTMLGASWEVVRTTSNTRELVTFNCRRMADGR